MAASIQGDGDEILSGINVTPLVDITLVLLIIFIVTAKIIVTQALPMDLPKAASGSEQQTIFSVELSAAGETAVDARRLGRESEIVELARGARAKTPELRAVIKADGAVPHARVVRVMDLLKQAGVARIAFGITQVAPEPTTTP
jgi:biopolymer transport protein ExbD